MKTIQLNALRSGKKFAMASLVATCLSFSAMAANTDSTVNKENASVACISFEEGQVYFKVNYENADGGRFDILVNDATGDNLYRGTFTGKDFAKVFRAPVDNGKLVIIIRDMKDKTSHTFELTTESKMIEQIYVKRM